MLCSALVKRNLFGYSTRTDNVKIMKKEVHPDNYRPVIFHDTTSGERFLISSTVDTEDTDKWEDGKEYPVFRVEISSASHPFYTGKAETIDTAGRIDKFRARQKAAQGKTGK